MAFRSERLCLAPAPRPWVTRAFESPLMLSVMLLGITAVWGWTFTVVKDAVAMCGPMPFLAMRFAVAALAMVALSRGRLHRPSVVAGVGVGCVLAVSYVFQTLGIELTSATNSGLITGLFVVAGPVLNRLLFGVRASRIAWTAVCSSFVGLALLAGTGARPPTSGDLLTLCCAMTFGLHIALLDRYAKHLEPVSMATGQIALAAAVFGIVSPMVEPVRLPPPGVWAPVLLTGVVGTALGFLTQTAAQRRLPAVRAAVILAMEPLFAAVFGYCVAGDRLTPPQIIGATVMISAFMVVECAPLIANGRQNGGGH